jgi:hypothetical protein
MKKEKDVMKDLCVKQGYVPDTCTMAGMMVFLLIQKEDPCAGCNEDRNICRGRNKKY